MIPEDLIVVSCTASQIRSNFNEVNLTASEENKYGRMRHEKNVCVLRRMSALPDNSPHATDLAPKNLHIQN